VKKVTTIRLRLGILAVDPFRMTFLRRYLRFSAVIWLTCQVASLSALGPQHCCPAHRLAAEGETDCHQTDDGSCPMHAATGKACPAHATESADSADRADTRPCVLRGTCSGPAVALASLFSINGILSESTRVTLDLTSCPLTASAQHSTPLVACHDTPPPRL
jgi:hypothetical protein